MKPQPGGLAYGDERGAGPYPANAALKRENTFWALSPD